MPDFLAAASLQHSLVWDPAHVGMRDVEDLIKQPFSSSKARMHYNLFSPFYCTVIFHRYIFFSLFFKDTILVLGGGR